MRMHLLASSVMSGPSDVLNDPGDYSVKLIALVESSDFAFSPNNRNVSYTLNLRQ